MLEINQIYLGDCFNVMSKIEDKKVDFVLIDPPYGVTASAWDSIIPFNSLWKELNRISKKEAVMVIFGSQPFTTFLISSNINNFKYCWYWLKNQGTNFFHAQRMPIRKVEEICVFGGKLYNPQISSGHIPTNSAKGCSNGQIYYGKNRRNYEGGQTTRYPNNILNFKCVNNYSKLHPNEKPVELLEYLIKTYTNEGDLVLDNCCGSGSTLIASKNTNRRFIGIEKEQIYYDIARKRLGLDS